MSGGWRLWAIVAGALVAASIFVVDRYGGLSFWPALVTEFGATLLAVVAALEIESRRANRALKRVEEQTDATRTTEARKRLLAVRIELEKNQTSIGEVADGLQKSAATAGRTWHVLHPQLLDGAWSASSERLGDLLADYELISDLSVFYGRVEELRWRLRYRTQARNADLDGMTFALADEMRKEVERLLSRVSAKEPDPGVRGVTHVARLSGSIRPAGTLTLEKLTKKPESDAD